MSRFFSPVWRTRPTRRGRLGSLAALAVAAVAWAALAAAPATAQTSATITGEVRSADGAAIPGAEVTVAGESLRRQVATDADGRYRLPALPAGTYEVRAAADGFAPAVRSGFALLLNSRVALDFELEVGTVEDEVTVTGAPALLDTQSSDTGGVVTPLQIATLPVNGRDYLDLMQLVPGVQVNREKDKGSDEAVPVLGERAGNAVYLLDGMPNRDEFGSGAASQFTQDSIQEFEVLTGGFKAEFGHGSGGVVNVVTKGGGSQWRGAAVGFVRDDGMDSSNSLEAMAETPSLSRENVALNLGGPLVADRAFIFASAERIDEERELNFAFPPATPAVLRDFENSFDFPATTEENRYFLKVTEQIGDRHRLDQQLSVSDGEVGDFLPLSAAASLPSTRNNLANERTMLGLRQTSLFGDGNWIFEGHLQYREHTDVQAPAHPEAGAATAFSIFSSPFTFQLFGDLGIVAFGNPSTGSDFDQEYLSAGPSLAASFGNHEIKFGLDYLGTQVNGSEASILANQLFATEANFARFGPVYSGLFTLTEIGPRVAGGDNVALDNDYTALYVQDDWSIGGEFVLNMGLRYDRDSEFEKNNLSPRLGFAWSPTDSTVISGSAGVYYDRFRLGLVRNIAAFGGADMNLIQDLSYPQGFYNITSIVPLLVGLCPNPLAPHAVVEGTPCLFGLPTPHLGVDIFNNIVAEGRSPIPPETVITRDNVQDLSGLSPEEYLARVNAMVPLFAFGPNAWYWGPFGALTHPLLPAQDFPIQIDPAFETPNTRAYHLGARRQFGRNHLVTLDLHYREMRNILGVRETNLEFVSRIPGSERTYQDGAGVGVRGFGPWFEGEYKAATVGYTKRLSNRFSLSAHYTYTDAVDNLVSGQLGNGALSGPTATGSAPTDSFVGTVPVVTDPTTGQTNENGSFTAGNGNFIPRAGTFHNGPDLDKGPSPFAVDDQFVLFGLVDLPLGFQLSGIYRYTSGFRFSESAAQLSDPDGNLSFSIRDTNIAKNSFQAPSYQSLDLRLAKFFELGNDRRLTFLVEFFNATNEQNPAAVEAGQDRPTAFGQPLQVLPGREGQIGLRFEF